MKKCLSILIVLATSSLTYAESPDELDLKIMGLCAVASLTTAMQNPQACAEMAEICKLSESIDTLDRDLSRTFAFVKRIQQVQPLRSGVYKGRGTRASGPETIVFVTEAIPALQGSILVLVSASSPSRVAIFSLAPSLKGELIYDSFDKPKYFSNGIEVEREPPIEAIGRIVVDPKGSISLTEYTDGPVSRLARRFKIAYVENGHPTLQLLKAHLVTRTLESKHQSSP